MGRISWPPSEVLAAAILDRLMHDAEVLTINNGPSFRLKGRLEALSGSGDKAGEGAE